VGNGEVGEGSGRGKSGNGEGYEWMALGGS